MAIIKHISDGTNTYDLPSGEAFSIRLSATLAQIAAGGNFSLSGVKTADVKAAIAAKQPIVFTYDDGGGGGIPSLYGEILVTNLGDTGGSGLALTNGTIVLMNGNTLKIMKVVFSGGATNVTSVTLTDVTPQSGAANLYDLQDVNIHNPQDGDVLTYSSSLGAWVAEQPGGGGGGSQLPVIIDIGRVIHENGMPQPTIADVPQSNYVIPFDRQITFSYRAYESGFYNRYWTVMPDAYKIALKNGGAITSNYEDLHWIVQDMINNQQLPLQQDIEYRLMLYKTIQNAVYCLEIPLWISTNTSATKIEFYLDSSEFDVRQVAYIGADN